MMQIQHAGLYASVNNLRGVALDGQFPIVLLIGLLGRDPELEPEEDGSSMVRLCRPLLETLDIPSHLLDGPGRPASHCRGLRRGRKSATAPSPCW